MNTYSAFKKMIKKQNSDWLLKLSSLFILALFFYPNNVRAEYVLNSVSQAILSDPNSGLVATTISNYNYVYASRNTLAIQSAIDSLTSGQKLLLPAGVYDVETIFIPQDLSNIEIAGNGIDATTLRRKGFQWNNNTQGDCSLHTEILVASGSSHLGLKNITLDGNCHHIAISGYGTWNTTNGNVLSGTPQFPTFISADTYQSSSGSVISYRLGYYLSFDSIQVKNGYRWAIFFGKISGLTFRNSIVSTGNISTEFKGHYDVSPNNTVMHMHTSQDGIHLVNVSNAEIEYNDIHSEDSAIAFEINPSWNWGGFDYCKDNKVNNNYISTLSPTDSETLLNNDDGIYGQGLASQWVGQGAVDIFYNESYDTGGTIYSGGSTCPFRNFEIFQNAFNGVRYGVRAGFFIGAGSYDNNHYNHRIYNINVHDQVSSYMAGRNKNKPAGMSDIVKNTISGSWNLSGGAGVAIRNTDEVTVENNEITDVTGGIGISITNVRDFNILNNTIDQVSGTELGTSWFNWDGGEGIRVWNDNTLSYDPNIDNGIFDADSFLIQGNYIGEAETYKIAVISTKNGIVKKNKNFDLSGNELCEYDDALLLQDTENIETGACEQVVITSDTFEDDTAWLNYDQTNAPVALNNGLGGTGQYTWSTWGGITVNSGNSATGGTKCLQAHWGGLFNLQGFEIDPDVIYQLEVMVHPPGGNDGTWNNWGAVHLMTLNNNDVWQTQGFRVRLTNGGSGNNPNHCTVDYWLGEDSVYGNTEILNFDADSSSVYVDGVNSSDFWIPVKLIFTGEGTTSSPFCIKYFLNDTLRASQEYTNVFQTGDRMIGFSNNGNSQDVARFDNFKLTKIDLEKTTSSSGVTNFETGFLVYPNPTEGEVQLTINGDEPKNLSYKLYDLNGRLLQKKEIDQEKTTIVLNKYRSSIYILQIFENNKSVETLKILKI